MLLKTEEKWKKTSFKSHTENYSFRWLLVLISLRVTSGRFPWLLLTLDGGKVVFFSLEVLSRILASTAQEANLTNRCPLLRPTRLNSPPEPVENFLVTATNPLLGLILITWCRMVLAAHEENPAERRYLFPVPSSLLHMTCLVQLTPSLI